MSINTASLLYIIAIFTIVHHKNGNRRLPRPTLILCQQNRAGRTLLMLVTVTELKNNQGAYQSNENHFQKWKLKTTPGTAFNKISFTVLGISSITNR